MVIKVSQKNIPFGAEYDIETPACFYVAKQKASTLKDRITLFAPRERVVARISGGTWFFRTHYDFDISDGRFYEFWIESQWKGVYVCENRKESYRLYRHKGLNYSIFQNELQIAAFTQNEVTVGAADQYEVLLNDDADPIVVICMVLAIDATENPGTNQTVVYNGGNIGPEERPFDSSWLPS